MLRRELKNSFDIQCYVTLMTLHFSASLLSWTSSYDSWLTADLAISTLLMRRYHSDFSSSAIVLNFGMWGDITIHWHNHFCQIFFNQFRGFRVLTPPNLLYTIGLAGRSYNSISTAVLYCDFCRLGEISDVILTSIQRLYHLLSCESVYPLVHLV